MLGVTLFGKNDPKFMGSLHVAMLTLFRVSVGDDWTDVSTDRHGVRGGLYSYLA